MQFTPRKQQEMVREELVKLIKEQIKIEKNFVNTVNNEIKGVHNIAARLLLLETQKDSEKHAMILEGILKVIDQADAKPLWDTIQDSYIDKIVVKKNLEGHIKTEIEMLEHIQKEIKASEDEGIKLLLKHIESDEKKHHEILQTIVGEAYKITP